MWLPPIADGIYNYKNRIYHSRLGRFLQADPIGYGDGMNIYGYVGGDPINLTDPTGLASDSGSDGFENPVVCTGTRIADGCGPGGIANNLSGFSTAGVGGQYPTGEASLNPVGINTSGMSGAEMRKLAGSFLGLAEFPAASGAPRNTVITWGFSHSSLLPLS